ncbi:MAG TPA: hypothetical protein VH372_20755 [Actinospica sp.]|nr:hypothetical protein [Actinospica sp.]
MTGLAWAADETTPTELCRIVCETAAITVSRVPTGNGARLRLVSERSGASSLLDATVLEALCHLDARGATELVRAHTEDAEAAA